MSRKPHSAQLDDLDMVDKLRADADALRAFDLERPNPSLRDIAARLYAASDRLELAAFGIDVDAIAVLYLTRDLVRIKPNVGHAIGATIERALIRKELKDAP